MKIGFDVISDLNLTIHDDFNWVGKATSTYCIVAGNISHDLNIVKRVLFNLGQCYHAVFYTPGNLEHEDYYKFRFRNLEIVKLCRTIPNVSCLHNFVIIIDGVAIVGVNGWSGDSEKDPVKEIFLDKIRYVDLEYLNMTIERLQIHKEVKKIVVVSHSVPNHELYFGEHPPKFDELTPLTSILGMDSEQKISHWVYGKHHKQTDILKHGIHYVNNSCYKRNPYWPKRIEVEI